MFTSCPECGTVFRIGPAELRRAAGRVRCGTCGAAFNALESLSDSSPAESPEAAPVAPTSPQPGPAEPAPAPAAQAAEALEFDVPPERWSSFFEGPPPHLEATVDPAPLEAAAGGDWDELLADLHEEEDEPPAAVYVIDSPAGEGAASDYPPEQLASTVDLPARQRLYPAPVLAASAASAAWASAAASPPGPAAGTVAGDEPDPDPLVVSDEATAPPFRSTRPPARRRWPWALGSLLLLLALAGQWIHLNRDSLAAHPAWGELVQQTYGRIGQTLYPAWDLSAYRVLGSEAIAGRAAPDALEIVARLQVTGPAPIGLPLLRVMVRDRWGNTVGERLIEPAEYAPERGNSRVAPGSVLPVTISLRDPGTEAHGYEIDLCLRQREQGMTCQQDRPVFRR